MDGDCVVPTERSRGPWFADQQHGAALLGLLTRFLERVPSAQPMRFTRITADLSRPARIAPCTVKARLLREGRRVQSLEAIMEAEGRIVSRATATRIRVEPGLIDDDLVPPPRDDEIAPPLSTQQIFYESGQISFHDCLEIRSDGRRDDLSDECWFRLASPLVEGEEPSPTVRLASIGDMILSSSYHLGPGWISINPEVMLQMEREPVGEWLFVASRNRLTSDGIAMAEGVLFDSTRRVGRSSKSILNDRA